MADAHEQGGTRAGWRIIVARERTHSGTGANPLSGLGYHHWRRVVAVENTETGALSGWCTTWHALAAAAIAAGVEAEYEELRGAVHTATERWQDAHPIQRCASCCDASTPPRGRHRPASHRRVAPWEPEMGGSPDPRDADDVAHIWPDGSYEVPHA